MSLVLKKTESMTSPKSKRGDRRIAANSNSPSLDLEPNILGFQQQALWTAPNTVNRHDYLIKQYNLAMAHW